MNYSHYFKHCWLTVFLLSSYSCSEQPAPEKANQNLPDSPWDNQQEVQYQNKAYRDYQNVEQTLQRAQLRHIGVIDAADSPEQQRHNSE